MKFVVLLISFFAGQLAYSADSKIDADISEVVTLDSWKDSEFRTDVSPYYRFRAIKYNPIKSESGGGLVVEKLYRGGVGSPYKVLFSEKLELLANDAMKDEFKKLSFEFQIGCCHASNIKWDEFKLTYTVSIAGKYICEIENVNKKQRPVCRKDTN